MRNLLTKFLLTAVLAIFATGCATRIEPGNVGLKISNLGSDKGVSAEVLGVGYTFYTPGLSTIVEYPAYVQRYEWRAARAGDDEGRPNEEICFNTSGGKVEDSTGAQVCGDLAFGIWIDPNSAPKFYQKYRVGDLERFGHGILRDIARNTFNEIGATLTVEEAMSSKRKHLESEVERHIAARLKDDGVRIANVGFVSALRPPPQITEKINAKIAAIQDAQRVENELRKTEAEAKKAIAEAEGRAKARVQEAEGEAKANQVLVQSLTPQLLEWKRLELQGAAVGRWNGTVPQVSMGGSGAVPFVDVTKFTGK